MQKLVNDHVIFVVIAVAQYNGKDIFIQKFYFKHVGLVEQNKDCMHIVFGNKNWLNTVSYSKELGARS